MKIGSVPSNAVGKQIPSVINLVPYLYLFYTNTQFTDYKIEWKAETKVHFMRKELELDNTDFHTP